MYTVSCVALHLGAGNEGGHSFPPRATAISGSGVNHFRSVVCTAALLLAYLVVGGGVGAAGKLHPCTARAKRHITFQPIVCLFSTRRFVSAGVSTQREWYIPPSSVSFSRADANGLPDFFGSHGRIPASLMEGFVLAFPAITKQ